MEGREASFEINKYKKPVLLNIKESIAQIIINALFLVPGNLPGNPEAGVNIEQYLYRVMTDSDAANIGTALKTTCGSDLANTIIDAVSVQARESANGPIMVLQIRLLIDQEDLEEDSTLAVILQKQDDRVHINYRYMDEVLGLLS